MGPTPCEANMRLLGTDDTAGRDGEVAMWVCRSCSTRWLHYAVQHGPLGETAYAGLMPANVHPINAAAAESLLNASAVVFASIIECTQPCWTRVNGRVCLGIRH